MKKILLFTFLCFICVLHSQTGQTEIILSDLKKIYMDEGVNIHFISPEPIQFVDLSTQNLTGDLPTDNIARVKITDSLSTNKESENLGVITIVAQSFMAQYKVIKRNKNYHNLQTKIQINAEDMQPLELPKSVLSTTEMAQYCERIMSKKECRVPLQREHDFGLEVRLNNVYVVNDYIFLDITFTNDSNLSYSIDALKFTIDDKKIYKATNNQTVDMIPLYKLYNQKSFKKNYHNVYVFKKFTFPNSKVLTIRLLEEQLSGRTLEMKIRYSDILNADTL